MSDDKTLANGQDRKLIALNEDYEVRDWSKHFGVTPDQLRAAVQAVSHSAEAVAAHLKRQHG